jgi:predicted RNase H-like HicB family nuclease
LASPETDAIIHCMESTKYIYWQAKDQWLGYLQDYPDYWTQGNSLEDLETHLRDLYSELTSGEIPGVRKLAELTIR